MDEETCQKWNAIENHIRERIDFMKETAWEHRQQASSWWASRANEWEERASEAESLWGRREWEKLIEAQVVDEFVAPVLLALIGTEESPPADRMVEAERKRLRDSGQLNATTPLAVIVQCRWRANRGRVWTYGRAVQPQLPHDLCVAIAGGILFENDWSPEIDLEFRIFRGTEIIVDWNDEHTKEVTRDE